MTFRRCIDIKNEIETLFLVLVQIHFLTINYVFHVKFYYTYMQLFNFKKVNNSGHSSTSFSFATPDHNKRKFTNHVI